MLQEFVWVLNLIICNAMLCSLCNIIWQDFFLAKITLCGFWVNYMHICCLCQYQDFCHAKIRIGFEYICSSLSLWYQDLIQRQKCSAHSQFRKCHGGLYAVWKTSLNKTWAALSLLWVLLWFWHTWFATSIFENLQSQSTQQCLTTT